MRNFTNSILFESALDTIGSSNPKLANIAGRLLQPTVKVVETDCETELGSLAVLAERTEGMIELDTDLPVNRSALISASNSGKSSIPVRTLHSCVSKNGVCLKCLVASRPRLTSVSVGDFVRISPELTVDTESISIKAGSSSANLSHSASEYDILYVFDDGALVPVSSYSISGNVLTLTSPSVSDKTYLIKYEVSSSIAYFYWLARTYSSSLLGVKPMLNLPLPIKTSLLRSLVVESDIEDLYNDLLTTDVSGESFITYIPSIKDPLEKAIYVILLSAVFLTS